MAAVKRVLVVGGSVAGMSMALRLARIGVDVELAEIDPGWGVYGAGLTLTGASLRALEALGVLDLIKQRGFVSGGTQLLAPNSQLLGQLPIPAGDATVHSSGGIMRPVLHDILSQATRAAGIRVSLGVSVNRLEDDAEHVRAGFTDGRNDSYDLVIGADGVYSRVRELRFGDAPRPRLTGQGCWRMPATRAPEVDKLTIVVGHRVPLGFIPVSQTLMYMFLLEHVPDNPRIEAHEYEPRLIGLMQGLSGLAGAVRDAIGSSANNIHYRPLESVLLPIPWYRGRVVLIGDAAHATTPHLATGAGLAVEDALVLSQELERSVQIAAALDAYTQRRYARCRSVVETSLAIGEQQMTHADPQAVSGLMQHGLGMLLQPY